MDVSPSLVIVLGILLVVAGIGGFLIGSQHVDEAQSTLGQAERLASEDARQEYQLYSTIRIVGGVLAIAGLLVFIGGLVIRTTD